MKTKTFDWVEYNVYTNKKINGDFIHPDEAVYFKNDIEITGNLEAKWLKCEESIYVHGNYIVKECDEIGKNQRVDGYQIIGAGQEVKGHQNIGKYQEIGQYQEIGDYQIIDGYQTVNWYQKIGDYQIVEGFQDIGGCQIVNDSQIIKGYQNIGGYQEIGKYQEINGNQRINGYQEIGRYQEINGNLTAQASRVSLHSNVKGEYNVNGKVFIGVYIRDYIPKKEETLTCGKFTNGRLMYGKLVETGLPKKVKIKYNF